MNLADVLRTGREILAVELLSIAGTSVTVGSVLTIAAVLAIAAWISRLSQAAIKRAFKLRNITDTGTLLMVQRLVHYAVMAIAFVSALQTAGVDLDALLAAGAVFAVGFGLAMQSIAQNFVSGIILLVERSIRPGDVIEVEGQVVKVRELTVRNTIVRTLDDDELIVPNSILAQSTVRNYTKQDDLLRLRVQVGVTYGSDLRLVRDTLEALPAALKWARTDPAPRVLLKDFADSAVVYELSVWTDEPWSAEGLRSELREAVWWAFKEARITIAFPQLDVHVDDGLLAALRDRADA